MFNIGDKIVYPTQGVGIVDGIEEREFNGQKQSYYKIHLLHNTMNLMLPISKAEESNVRLISDFQMIKKTLNNLNNFKADIEELEKFDFKERKEINMSKVKSGTLADFVEVICNLTQLKAKHSLNSTDRQILRNAKNILIDEISQAENMHNSEAENMLESFINFN